jgi:hypothetical protein
MFFKIIKLLARMDDNLYASLSNKARIQTLLLFIEPKKYDSCEFVA